MTTQPKKKIDLDYLFHYMEKRFDGVATKEKVEEQISHLPTKDEYFGAMDKMMIEIQKAREDLAAHKSMHEDLDKDIPNLQHKVKHLYKIFEVEEPADINPAY